jgi:hypothetical protein
LLPILVLLVLLPGFVARSAQTAPNPEIAHLLQYIEKAQVVFIRSQKEYTPQQGADHLRSKLQKASGRVKTAEDFIRDIGSKSYLTGEEYRVRFPDGRMMSSGPWLREALAKHREER